MIFKNHRGNFKDFLIKSLATCGGVGYIPLAPGAAGAIIGVVLAYLIHPFSFFVRLLLFLGWAAVAIPVSGRAEKIFQEKDCSRIVLDETVGVLAATVWFDGLSWTVLIAAFLLFGLFDTFKPYPINISEKLDHGWGIVIDDTIAGLYAAGIIYLALLL